MRQRRRGQDDRKNPPLGAEEPQARRPKPLVSATARPPKPSEPTNGSSRSKRKGDPTVAKQRSKVSRHPLILGANLFLLILVLGLVGGVAALVAGRNAYLAPGPLAVPVQINIPRGASLEAIAQGLEAQDVISNQYVFLAAIFSSGSRSDIKAGEYIVPARASMGDVIDKIVSGDVVQHPITVAEGLTSAQVVEILNASPVLSGSIREIPPEGSLLPETYSVTRGMPRTRVLKLMSDAQDRALAEIWQNRNPDLPLVSPQELVVLASIVEKETGEPDERDRVAAVFVNRLNQRMPLQSDPTILYGLYGGEAWSEPRTIYQSDLDRANPYNTYQIDALPPGPIANPGREALEATAKPAETNELFFVADGTGGHAFATTYEEHQANVAKWREIEANRGSNDTQQNTQ
ncbi:MAG: endolytic transglycosylase MltG [Pseudomonadota bacterium]